MAQYAAFANDRLDVVWELSPDSATPGGSVLKAHHPRSLDRLTWLLPAQRYAQPSLVEGSARIDRDGPYWRVIAGPSTVLQLRLPANPIPTTSIPAP